MREALAADRRHFGNQHMSVAVDLNYLGAILQDRGKFDEAGRALRRIDGHSHRAASAKCIRWSRWPTTTSANLRMKQSRWDDAERAFRRAIEIRNALGQQKHRADRRHGEDARPRVRSARATRRSGAAGPEPALAILREASPAGSPTTADALETLGNLKVRQKQASEGEPLIREALEFRRKSLPAGAPVDHARRSGSRRVPRRAGEVARGRNAAPVGADEAAGGRDRRPAPASGRSNSSSRCTRAPASRTKPRQFRAQLPAK